MNNNFTKRYLRPLLILLCFLSLGLSYGRAQEIIETSGSTLRADLQQLGTQLMKGKKGSIVAIEPSTGEILCLVTNSADGPNDALAIATAYPPGSTIKPAQALTFLSEGIVTPQTRVGCHNGFRDGNIKVKCHPHYSPEPLIGALAVSCNTWFLKSYLAMLGDNKKYETKENAVTTWRNYLVSMGLGGPLGVDIPGEKGGLLANVNYLNRRYKDTGWTPKTIMWAGMGQGDITVTPLQLCNLAVTIANRGFFFTPHIRKNVEDAPLSSRFLTPRHTKVSPEAYAPVIAGMRQVVTNGTARSLNTKAYTICGKTGTAENEGKDHSAFIGFAPMNDPKIAIAVYIEHGGFGADLAAPIAGLVMQQYMEKKLNAASLQMAKRIERVRTITLTNK